MPGELGPCRPTFEATHGPRRNTKKNLTSLSRFAAANPAQFSCETLGVAVANDKTLYLAGLSVR